MANEKTRADLRVRVLDVLGVSAAGNNPSAEDVQHVDDQLDAVLESLAARSIVNVPNPDEIPLAIFQELAIVVGDAMAVDFGLAQNALRVVDASGVSPYDRAEKALRVMNAGKPAYGPLRVDYF